MIKINNVSKKFRDKIILNNVNLEFKRNNIYGIFGANGSGKTVLLKVLLGLMNPSEGEITIDGKLLGKDIKVIPNVGAIIETPCFYEDISAYDNLIEISKIKNCTSKERIIELMNYFSLDSKNNKCIKKYSLGMRQKTALVQVFMENPHVIILDEPTNSLDEKTAHKLYDLIRKFKNEDTTIIIVTHNRHEIQALCDVVIEMVDGKCYVKDK